MRLYTWRSGATLLHSAQRRLNAVPQDLSIRYAQILIVLLEFCRSSTFVSHTRYPMPSSSACSSGVPQRRQISDAQSPQASGSSTGLAQVGQ